MRAVIIEDESIAANRLQDLVGQLAPEMEIKAQLHSVAQATAWFEQNPMPELIFLDINMPPIGGFEFLEQYADQIQALDPVPVIVIVSTTVNPVDLDRAAKVPLIKKFLCKPLSPEHLSEAASLLH